MTLRAVDLSHVKAITDWDALCGFADILILKATEGSPEGTSFADPLFASRLAEARRRGKLIGVYHYVGSSVAKKPGAAKPGVVYSAVSEADWFAGHYGWQPGEVPIADYEPANPPADPDGWLADFLQRLTGKGWPVPMSYMNTSAAASSPWTKTRAVGTGLWLARYYANNGQVPTQQPSPGSFGAYAMWQYTSNGVVPGVTGPTDVSLFYGTPDQWRAYGTAPNTPEDDLSAAAEKQIAEIHAWMRGGDPTKDNLTLIWEMLKGGNPDGQNNFNWLDSQSAQRAEALTQQAAQAVTQAVTAALAQVQATTVDAGEVSRLVLAGLNGAQLNVTTPAAS